jgi:hypothetical protein
MTNDDTVTEVLDACAERRQARRSFLRSAGAIAAVGGTSLLAACSDSDNRSGNDGGGVTPPPTGGTPPPPSNPPTLTDPDILNFALNLEYLEAQFYSFAAFGVGLPENLLGGTGTRGGVEATGARRVNFTDPVVAQYAREIAADERQHVAFLRRVLGGAAVAQPLIDIGIAANGAFSAAARASGLVGPGEAFDAYATDEFFLLGAFIFEDVGVTAYKGAAPLITNKTFLEAAAGILAAESYHAGLVRTVLYAKGLQTPTLRTSSTRISNARDTLDGPDDRDQGVEPIGNMSNIVPVDQNGIAYSRRASDVLNIVYLSPQAVAQGGFFPAGVNGTIRLSSAD